MRMKEHMIYELSSVFKSVNRVLPETLDGDMRLPSQNPNPL